MDLIPAREAGEMLGLRPGMIYHYLKSCPEVTVERVGRVLGIRLEDLPRIREVVRAARQRQEMQSRSLTADGRWLLASGAAKRLGVSHRTLYRWTRAGEIRGRRLERPDGRAIWRWDPNDLSPPPKKHPGRRRADTQGG